MVSTEALRTCELFDDLSEEELQEVAGVCREESHEGGCVIFAEGSEATTLYILQEGKVRLEYQICPQPDFCREIAIVLDRRGQVFGWSALVRPRRLTATARCVGGVTLIAIEVSDLNDIMEKNSHIGFEVMKKLAEVIASRLREAKRLVGERVMGIL